MSERWVTIGEVAERLGISRPTARKYLRDGDVPGMVDHYGFTRVDRQVFEKWMDSKDHGKSGKS